MRVSMTKARWQATVVSLEQAASAVHRGLSDDERKTLSDRLWELADDLRGRAGLPPRVQVSNPTE